MNADESRDRLLQIHHLGEINNLTVLGFLRGHGQLIIQQFRAGKIDIEPPIDETQSKKEDYRLRYTSWDGERNRDLSELTDDELVEFLKSEPSGIVEVG